MKLFVTFFLLIVSSASIRAAEYHVSPAGDDAWEGGAARPFRTISAAARVAQPGDLITVHEGVYRERVTPPRGGASDSRRIVYQAAEGETAVIKGSEIARGWKPFIGDVWKLTLQNSFFGSYNPYKDLIWGDWFVDRRRPHHTGEVYLNGKSLYESHTLEAVLNPKPIPLTVIRDGVTVPLDSKGTTYTWYCESDEEQTYIYANFHGKNPNQELVEINVRDSCFYPDEPGRNYITVRGFRMSQAATQWAAPTAEQIGLIGTHWSKGWIIENNVISDSKCSGITLGKDRKTGHNVWSRDRCKDGATHYNEVIVRALEAGWSREKIGGHIVRHNVIFNCEQAGICGSMGGAFSQITDNHIYNIWTKRLFSGAEIAGIKLHGPIDALIANNRLHNVGRGLWMDWMTQGARITRNLCYDNTMDDLFVEVNHGPFLVDNNIFLSDTAIRNLSEGGAYVHNLVAGRIIRSPQARVTPYHEPHSTALAGLKNTRGGDDRFYNNILVAEDSGIPDRNFPTTQAEIGYGLEVYDRAELPLHAAGNVYLNGAKPCVRETNYIERPEFDPDIRIVEDGESVHLEISFPSLDALATRLVTTDLLGSTVTSGLPFANPDGSPLTIDTDYFGRRRNASHPYAGPFEQPGVGRTRLELMRTNSR
ncbi:MAG TPA: right-handed parallel beta-helix repeat-containing protein [Acidobacteriota bacterium]|nr:right-handed parallel beta-helix repeat-containing protein [Acidobacteriota bacterium]